MANRSIVPIPQDKIGESFVWRDWFQKLSDTVYGSMASQNATNVNITGGTISNINFNGVAITKSTVDSTPIGNSSASTGRFTSIKLDTALAVAYGGTGVKTAAANYVFAGPTAGAAAAPSFRALVVADIPALPYSPTTSGTSILYGNGSGGFSNVTIGSGITFAGGTLSATGSGGTVTSVTGTAPIASSGGTTPAISISQASTSTNGYLSSTDWNTFNGKQPAGTYVTSVTGTAPVVSSGGTTPAISMAAASTSVSGYLTSTDWNTFNGKQAAGTYVTAITIASSNGFAGTSSGGATPSLTLSTSITGLLKGNGTAISAASSGTDYAPATSGTSILYGNGSGGFSNVTVGTGLSFSAGTLASTASTASAPITKTADFTVGVNETWFINNKTGSTCVVTLPSAATYTGRELTFKNMQAQLLNSATSNVVPIDSTSAGTAILLGVVGNWATLVSDGTNWVIMQAASNNNLLLE